MTDEGQQASEDGLDSRVLVMSLSGVVDRRNGTRDLCARFIPKGDGLYDRIARYDDDAAFLLGRSDHMHGCASKFVAPFLKAFGATDYAMHAYAKANLRLMAGAERAVGYLSHMLPLFVSTSAYEHHAAAVAEALGIPHGHLHCTEARLDEAALEPGEMRRIRAMASEINSLRMPVAEYELGVPNALSGEDVALLRVMDRIFGKEMPKMGAAEFMSKIDSVGTDDKAYHLVGGRRDSDGGFGSLAYIGGGDTDFQAMRLVRDGGGLSIAFNGSDFAVRGAGVAVLSDDFTAAAVLASAFHSGGASAVTALAEEWGEKALARAGFADSSAVRAMLSAGGLPEVYRVTRGNEDYVAERSGAFRKRLLASGKGRRAEKGKG
ncbi:MAG: hypothetical protein LBG62_00575 [Candidatus Methanoplasma sp.]|jgi:energy-converting hydrogenase A subunit R|nr:hypothetical protein [Candidatus Methanoplasma sp.]